jgi:hypothetical protein
MNISANSNFYFVLENETIQPKQVNPNTIRLTVSEALGLPRIISVEVGFEKDPVIVKTAIQNSELRNLEVWAVKDRKIYLAPKDFLKQFGIDTNNLDVKAKSNIIEALKKEVHPVFNTLGAFRLKPTWLPQLDGVVIVVKEPRKTAQISLACKTSYGLVTSKGTLKAWERQLDCPPVPEGYDGWLNLSGTSVNGVKIQEGECPPEWIEQACLVNGKHFFVSLQTELNIYRAHVSPAVAQFWPNEAKSEYLRRWVKQIEDVIAAKAKNTTPNEVSESIGKLLKPFGSIADLLDISSKLGAFPKSAEKLVEDMYSLAILRLITEGPMALMAFAYIFPGKNLKPGEVILPVDTLKRAGLLNKFLSGREVHIEAWRNPVLPGLDAEGRSPSAGKFTVVGIAEGNDVLMNPSDVAQMGGDFDGDRVSIHLGKPFGLRELSPIPNPVKKIKTGNNGYDPLSKLGGLSAYLGEAYNLCANAEDNAKGGSVGEIGWASVQACVASQKHEVELELNGQYFTTGQPGPRQLKLTWEQLRALIQRKANQISSNTKPSSAMEAWRLLRGAPKTLATATVVLSRSPLNSEGFMSQVLKLGRLSTKIKPTQVAICSDEEFVDYILNSLRTRRSECQSEIVPINPEKVRELLAKLDRAQQQGSEELPEVDNTWGFNSFYREWSKLMLTCDHHNRIHNMIRLILGCRERKKSIWYTLRILASDYMLVRAIGREADKPLNEVYQPSLIDLSSREVEPQEADEDKELAELKVKLGI